jgi:hypothetical protein
MKDVEFNIVARRMDDALQEQLHEDHEVDRIEEQTFFDDRAVVDEIDDYVFTFGENHIWPLTGTSLGKNYVKLRGTFEGARREMNRRFNNQWAFQYLGNDQTAVMINRYELVLLRLEQVKEEYR